MLSSRKAFQFAIIFLLLVAGGASFGQTLKPGPQVLTFFSDVDDTEQPYGLYLPKNFNPKSKYPLVIMLHGAGSNHRLDLRRVFGKSNMPGETDVEATRYFPEWKEVNCIVATPYARGTMGYQSVAETDVYDVLADVKRRFPIDEDRIYLTGLSMGGGGTLWLGLSRPDIWAALAPVCPVPPDGTAELAPNALNYPVHFFHGDADPVVAPAGVREWVKRFEDLGTKVEYTEYPGVGHNSWENAYKDEAIFAWFAQFRRNRYPDRVRFNTNRYKYNGAYWVQIDELAPGTLASIDAKFTGPNRLEISTSELGAFTLNLAGHPKFVANRPVELSIDGNTVTAKVTNSLSLSKREGQWTAAKYVASAYAKRPEAEGPISAAIASRHVYVYGTADNPSPEVLQARREQADHAANWSVDRGPFLRRVMVFPRVLADTEVRPSDLETSNLILFGTKETNSLIAEYGDRLPIQYNAATAGYGLVYIFPVGERYLLINSGLPWWSVAEPAQSPAPTTPAPRRTFPRLISGPITTLMGFGDYDYVLFKWSAENLVAAGHFDSGWRVSDSEIEKMQSSGAVTIGTVTMKSQN
ncbi:MAG: alpha/beta hydrolase-fold protein [bacterium]